jgi:stearoyl-CoA desaturase (delta-9 desaturase)
MISISRTTKEKTFFIAVHSALLYSIINCAITGDWYLLFISYCISLFHGILGNNITLHRLYAHKSFTVGKIKSYFLLAESVLFGAGLGPITYAAIHRAHHAHSDTELDPHSPHTSNKFMIALGLIMAFRPSTDKRLSGMKVPKDLLRDSKLKWTEANYYNIWILLCSIIWLVFGFNSMIYFLIVPTVLFSVVGNIANGIFSHTDILPLVYRTYGLDDKSVNSPISQVITFGEGYQNNHHYDQVALNQAFKAGEFDPTWYILKWFILDKETIKRHEYRNRE